MTREQLLTMLCLRGAPKGIPQHLVTKVTNFLQMMCNRLWVGHMRYGPAAHEKQYIKRSQKELRAYIKSGNKEHLVNIANYMFLEYITSDNTHDNNIDSVTRRSF